MCVNKLSYEKLAQYCDSGYAGGPDLCRSVKGYTFYVKGVSMRHQTKAQRINSFSSAKDEHIILLEAFKDIMFLLQLLERFKSRHISEHRGCGGGGSQGKSTAVSRLFTAQCNRKTKEKNKGKKKEEVYSAFSSKKEECIPRALFFLLLTSSNITQRISIRTIDK